ncbi:MAG: DUF4389 domain-containing protein, partial [Gaiellaceae bacterium]
LEKPVIAAVNGAAAGAGMSLALACDVRIAARSATFVPAFIKIGLIPDSGSTWLVRRLLGAARAFEWLTTGRRLGADEARDWGLVSEVVEDHELHERMHEVAALYAAMPTQAVWQTKRLLDEAEDTTFPTQLELEAVTQAEMTTTGDFHEGVAAFLQKREAVFTGAPPPRVHVVTLRNTDSRRRWRLTSVVRLPLAAPHIYLAYYWGLVALVVSIANWVITLVRGQSPQALHAWFARYVRYVTHVQAYILLAADPYPRFRGWEGTYPVDLQIDPPRRQARWKTAIRLVLAIPALVFNYVLLIVATVVAFLAWFVAVGFARVPTGFQNLIAYFLRYQAQTLAYVFMLTDRYPTLAGGIQLEQTERSK